MAEEKVPGKTRSVCPVCLNPLPAERILRGRQVFLRKKCPVHGTFETIIWRGYADFGQWSDQPGDRPEGNPLCPADCGLCSFHLQKTCCVLLNVTDRCNLDCGFCLAGDRGSGGEPSFREIRESLVRIIEPGKTLLQLSGGEPTLRDDLPGIVEMAQKAGAKYIQLNSNGIRLANDRDFVKKLAGAGLSFVFMQFDGTEDDIYRKIRNRPLLEIKKKAIDHCAEFNIGVTLVPTLVRGVNTQHIGDILRFAVSRAPEVRGVHFQPVTYLGKIPCFPDDSDRFTLDELVHEIGRQSGGLIGEENLLPSCCDHPLCGFHGDFIVFKGRLVPLLQRDQNKTACCCDPSAAEKNREFVGRRWQRPVDAGEEDNTASGDIRDMENFLRQVRSHGFTVTAMAFQDAGNIDLERLRQCSLHVYDRGRLVPFCSYYLSPWNLT